MVDILAILVKKETIEILLWKAKRRV